MALIIICYQACIPYRKRVNTAGPRTRIIAPRIVKDPNHFSVRSVLPFVHEIAANGTPPQASSWLPLAQKLLPRRRRMRNLKSCEKVGGRRLWVVLAISFGNQAVVHLSSGSKLQFFLLLISDFIIIASRYRDGMFRGRLLYTLPIELIAALLDSCWNDE
jgi:hypothetical protein